MTDLQDFVSRVPNYSKWNHADKIKFFYRPPDSADESGSNAPDHSIWRGIALVLAFLASWRLPGDLLNYRQRKADWLGRPPLPPPQVSFGRRAAGVALLVTGALMLIWAADARIELDGAGGKRVLAVRPDQLREGERDVANRARHRPDMPEAARRARPDAGHGHAAMGRLH